MKDIDREFLKAAIFSPYPFMENSAWIGHIPFATYMMNELRPRIFVELGTHWGHSYFAFCQTVKGENLECKCYAVDTWTGDDHAGNYGDAIYASVKNHNTSMYSEFSTLLKMRFEDALNTFADKSIDLLHIDGLHTYEAVKHDFETWLPKVSPRGCILFHDIDERGENFGVWKLWQELKEKYPNTFEFYHSHGLGVLQMGADADPLGLELFGYSKGNIEMIQKYFESLGFHQVERMNLTRAIADRDQRLNDSALAIADRDQRLNDYHLLVAEKDERIRSIYSSRSWKLTAPFRWLKLYISMVGIKIRSLLGRFLPVKIINRSKSTWHSFVFAKKRMGGVILLVKKTFIVFRAEGFSGILFRLNFMGRSYFPEFGSAEIQHAINGENNLQEVLDGPLITIIMPVYNPNPEWLDRAINSVLRQVYKNWELCAVDDGSTNSKVREVLERHVKSDGRVKVVYSNKNGGISAASNIALNMANGEYIGLLDHDDELTDDALNWVAFEIKSFPEADIIYTDENKIAKDGSFSDYFFKPDWSPELLFNCMYTGHLTIYRSRLIHSVGGFRSEYDFSQDYDLMLRASEVAKCIHHIPKVLYHWRQADGSSSDGGKPYARISNLNALQDAINRRGINGCVEELSTANRVKLNNWKPSISLVIPTDSENNLRECLESINKNTECKSLEIVVVTNSSLANSFKAPHINFNLKFSIYDKQYNFSDKCNQGAHDSLGDVIIFFNDDVRPLHADWVESLIEYLNIEGVGAVAPKLIYEDQRIQHAGLVTGVRGFVGTAFHCLPKNTTHYFNFAQSVRDVSAISGACFAMLKNTFINVGGFDEINTPIMHSDVDLSFKVREHGLRCLYTPHAELLHIGHQSLKEVDKEAEKKPIKVKDKSDIYLLKRWGKYITNDPYFNENMRNLLYHDSPEPIMMWGKENFRGENAYKGKDVLLVTHDLTSSGAPMVVFNMGKILRENGDYPVLVSPIDGPLREKFTEIGITVIVDPLILTRHDSVLKLAKNFDYIVANTVITWPIVYQFLNEKVPVFWYIHETEYARLLAEKNKLLRATISEASLLYVGSEKSRFYINSYRNKDIKVLPYGAQDIVDNKEPIQKVVSNDSKLKFAVLGTLEPRKGQDLFIKAIELLSNKFKNAAEFKIIGRENNKEFMIDLLDRAREIRSIEISEALSVDDYIKYLRGVDVVVCPSRDDTLPLVTIDALCLDKTLICSTGVGTSDYLTNGINGYVFENEDYCQLSKIINNLIADRTLLIKKQARKLYEDKFNFDNFKEKLLELLPR